MNDRAAMPAATHLVLIPSYDTGPLVYATVRAARAAWPHVRVVVDGSTDGTAEALRAMAKADPGLVVDVLPANRGKGAAVLHALGRRLQRATRCDDDGLRRPHSARLIGPSCVLGRKPDAMSLGRPILTRRAHIRFAPQDLKGLAAIETLGAGIGDCLGFASTDRDARRDHAREPMDARSTSTPRLSCGCRRGFGRSNSIRRQVPETEEAASSTSSMAATMRCSAACTSPHPLRCACRCCGARLPDTAFGRARAEWLTAR